MTKRVPVQLLTLVLTMCTVGVAAAQPAMAATCATDGFVHVRPVIVREADPLDGPPTTIVFDVPDAGTHSVTIAAGGGGLRPGSRPSWDVFAGGGYLGSLIGNTAGANCVSPEKIFPILGSAGDAYELDANYDTGNSGRVIRGQSHVIILFV